jgi:hypothetical protein
MMNDDLEKLRLEVNDLAGRAIVDSALLRLAILNASTPQLRTTHSMIGKLGDDATVKLQLRTHPLASRAFEDQKRVWQALLTQEITSREQSSPLD